MAKYEQRTQAGMAYATVSQGCCKHQPSDADRTAQLNLPCQYPGGAFKHPSPRAIPYVVGHDRQRPLGRRQASYTFPAAST
ncbi:MAG: hypothetical protein IPN76_34740 [Saprospiraceae bacterium]|nr:hypothetical protein [Saprospiraceae bacterium]